MDRHSAAALPAQLTAALPAQLTAQLSWRPESPQVITAASLHCTPTAFHCLKHTFILCATKLEMESTKGSL